MKKKHKVYVVYGKEGTVADYVQNDYMGDVICVYEFSSAEDVAAFEQALDDAMGWDECCAFRTRKEASAFVQKCLATS